MAIVSAPTLNTMQPNPAVEYATAHFPTLVHLRDSIGRIRSGRAITFHYAIPPSTQDRLRETRWRQALSRGRSPLGFRFQPDLRQIFTENAILDIRAAGLLPATPGDPMNQSAPEEAEREAEQAEDAEFMRRVDVIVGDEVQMQRQAVAEAAAPLLTLDENGNVRPANAGERVVGQMIPEGRSLGGLTPQALIPHERMIDLLSQAQEGLEQHRQSQMEENQRRIAQAEESIQNLLATRHGQPPVPPVFEIGARPTAEGPLMRQIAARMAQSAQNDEDAGLIRAGSNYLRQQLREEGMTRRVLGESPNRNGDMFPTRLNYSAGYHTTNAIRRLNKTYGDANGGNYRVDLRSNETPEVTPENFMAIVTGILGKFFIARNIIDEPASDRPLELNGFVVTHVSPQMSTRAMRVTLEGPVIPTLRVGQTVSFGGGSLGMVISITMDRPVQTIGEYGSAVVHQIEGRVTMTVEVLVRPRETEGQPPPGRRRVPGEPADGGALRRMGGGPVQGAGAAPGAAVGNYIARIAGGLHPGTARGILND